MSNITKISIAVHGGAQNMQRHEVSEEQERKYRAGLAEAVNAGWEVLERGGSSLEAVEAAVISLEDSPLFNAGRGSVLNEEGKVECDAAIMCGKTLKAGAVASVKNIKNPIHLARTVMDKTNHVLICSAGAEKLAQKYGLEVMPDEYFITEQRKNKWREVKESGATDFEPKGTVGAVALDSYGNVAAATSTGGLTYKHQGRVGDTPIIGAGTYANNITCAVSCTGDGEFIIRGVYAYEIHCLIKYKQLSLGEACREVLRINGERLKAEMGIIAIDTEGNIEMVYNTMPMFRGYRTTGMDTYTVIWEA